MISVIKALAPLNGQTLDPFSSMRLRSHYRGCCEEWVANGECTGFCRLYLGGNGSLASFTLLSDAGCEEYTNKIAPSINGCQRHGWPMSRMLVGD